ncbi:HTH-type transcriptional activator RhaS [Chryseobacterium sp. MOF25P]|uniref:helix-turn-helix domain-containing protein n=1 Tax=unclassified Chryseobacterium TaxID=2593645 RepID=UPI000804808F|nr:MULTISPECIES: helix-turn-helix transcriptional regulator [unclassified Chryseobacterium]OBW40197.1 HTH-type transcriptional activator RhaS [Chryseobacterium sp. MOF25P]OBW43717.1 HTH-type transcriptional activator RhaS [Chryseobacterium sp. BGARF1]
MTKFHRVLFLVLLFILNWVKGQDDTQSKISPKFEKLVAQIKNNQSRNESYNLSKTLIAETKRDGEDKDLLQAYVITSGIAPDSLATKYCDSILNIAIKLKDQTAIGASYFSIAGRSMRVFDYKKAAEYFAISYDYYLSQKNTYWEKTNLLSIGRLKSLIGEDNAASNLFLEHYNYFKSNQITPDHKFSFNFAKVYIIYINSKLKKYKENETLIREVYTFFDQNKKYSFFKFHILLADGRNDFSLGNYNSALVKLENARKAIDLVDSQNLDNIDFYIAMCYWKMGNIDKAFPIFENIKKNFLKTKKTSLEFRPTFDFFTEYYKKNGTTEQQLASLNDLLEFDKYEKDVKSYVQLKLKDFDEKHKTEEEFLTEDEQRFGNWLSIAIISLSSIAVAYFVYKKVKTKTQNEKVEVSEAPTISTNFHEQQKTEEEKQNEISLDTGIDYSLYRPINKLTVDQILGSMKTFETSLGFLEQDLKLTALAQKFNTNEKYLSKVIKVNLGKTFNAYLTDLRFEYLDEKLKTDSQFKNQMIKEISSKLGFGSPEFFATAFKEKYGKSPKEYFEA